MLNKSGFTRDTGEAGLEKGIANLIVYGSAFLANPDLRATLSWAQN
jgi:hypothetical protein